MCADFAEWSKEQDPLAAIPFHQDGWVTFTPDNAVDFLRRTVQEKGNRRPSFQQVVYYALQMRSDDWVKTGQPIIYDTQGRPLDGQHRAWASAITGTAFETYLVRSVPAQESIFAYIDNGKSRLPADALETAGMNGQSRILTAVIKFAQHYDAGTLTATSKGHVPKPSPMDVMRYVTEHPGIRDAVHLQVSEYPEANELMFTNYVGPFAGWKIVEAFGENVLDDFMTGLMQAEATRTTTDPLVALRTKLEANRNAEKPMKGHQTLAHVIKAFNAWRLQQPLRQVAFRVDEAFPRFVVAEPAAEAA